MSDDEVNAEKRSLSLIEVDEKAGTAEVSTEVSAQVIINGKLATPELIAALPEDIRRKILETKDTVSKSLNAIGTIAVRVAMKWGKDRDLEMANMWFGMWLGEVGGELAAPVVVEGDGLKAICAFFMNDGKRKTVGVVTDCVKHTVRLVTDDSEDEPQNRIVH